MATVTQESTLAGLPTLSWRLKLMYGAGEISNSVKVVTFALYSLFFATRVQGLPGTLVGIVAFVSMIWDAFVDPVVGNLTDGAHAVSKRYSFMLIGALSMGLGLYAFFSPPYALSMFWIFAWLLIASFLLRTATSLFNISYYAIGAAVANDYQERTSITGIRNMAASFGTLLTASLSAVVFFPDRVPGVDAKLNPHPYSMMGLAFGVIMTICALVAWAGVLPVRQCLENRSVVRLESSHFLRSMRVSLRNRSLRIVVLSFSLVVVGLAVNSSLLIHYLTYYIGVNGSAAIGSSQAAFYSAGLLGTFFWLPVSRKFDKHILYSFSAGMTAVLMLGALFLFGKGHPLGTGDIRPLLIGFGLAGFFGCMLWFLPPSMLADIADESEWITGKRQEGVLFGVLSFGKQIATGVAILIAGILLDRYVGLSAGHLPTSAGQVYRIGVLYSVVPAVLFCAAAILMLSYRLTRARVSTVQAELRRRSQSG